MAGLKKKFADQADAISGAETVTDLSAARHTKKERGPMTGPGTLLAFQSQMEESETQVTALKDRVRELEQGAQILPLDPAMVAPSKLANRHKMAWKSEPFKALKAEIKAAGGNLQPIKVRPIAGREGSYEVVFGHRRHQACLELGLPVLALVEPMDDAQLFLEMDRENRERADLSPYEQGVHYKRALDLKIYASARKMAEALGIDNGRISKALILAELPPAVIAAFESPLDVQYRWGKMLADALVADPDGVLSRAKGVKADNKKQSAPQILAQLLNTGSDSTPGVSRSLGENGQGRLVEKGGAVTVTIASGALTKKRVKELADLLDDFLKG